MRKSMRVVHGIVMMSLLMGKTAMLTSSEANSDEEAEEDSDSDGAK
jgi:hypothetical protein